MTSIVEPGSKTSVQPLTSTMLLVFIKIGNVTKVMGQGNKGGQENHDKDFEYLVVMGCEDVGLWGFAYGIIVEPVVEA